MYTQPRAAASRTTTQDNAAARLITAGRADLAAAQLYIDLANLTTDPRKKADLLQRSTEAAAIGRRKLRGTV